MQTSRHEWSLMNWARHRTPVRSSAPGADATMQVQVRLAKLRSRRLLYSDPSMREWYRLAMPRNNHRCPPAWTQAMLHRFRAKEMSPLERIGKRLPRPSPIRALAWARAERVLVRKVLAAPRSQRSRQPATL